MMAFPTDPNELAALAGEYVLGTLDARTARQIEQALAGNAELRALVDEWERRLAPLTSLALPEAPPPDLWARIEQAVDPQPVPAVRPMASRFLRLWQGWAIGASVVAAVLAGIAFLPQTAPQAPRMMTVLVSDPSQTAWTAEVDRKGGIRLAALAAPGGGANNTAPEGGKVLEMWALPPGQKVPTSLGLVPRGQTQVSVQRPAVQPVDGMLILISLEPPGGAPNGTPTGPVLFVGRLTEAGPPT
jgi:anti-sigma-K factor RskA